MVECFLFPLFFNKGCRVYKYLPLRPFSEVDFWTKLYINYVKVDHDKLLITSIGGIVVCVLLIFLIKKPVKFMLSSRNPFSKICVCHSN